MNSKRWPLRMKLELGAYPGAPGVVRDQIRFALHEWGMDAYFPNARIVASEIINNAIQATDGIDGHLCKGKVVPGRPPIRVWMRGDGEQLVVEVWDASPRLPVKKEPVEMSERGHGLVIVDELSERWGVFYPDNERDNSGKIVYAQITKADV